MKDSVRLNMSLRLNLRRAVLRHKFQKEGDAIFEERRRIALWAYNFKFGEATRASFAALPKGWLPEIDCMPFRAAGGTYSYRFDGRAYWRNISHSTIHEAVLMSFDKRSMRAPNKFEQPHINTDEFVLAVQRVEQRQEKFSDAVKNAYLQVFNMLNSYTTIGTLKKAWPEITPFIPAEHEVKVEPVRLPAVQPAVLNAMLDLPV